jgi:hypothetical protein
MKRAAGNPGKRKLPKREPRVQPNIPVPRCDLGPEGSRSWAERVAQLEDNGVRQATDDSALTVLAALEGKLAAELPRLEAMNLSDSSGDGAPTVNSALRAVLQITKEYRYWVQLFGFTPSSRAQIHSSAKLDDAAAAEEAAATGWKPVTYKGGKA